jgi:hypothetical protein
MTSANVSMRKPHAGNAGFVCERKARLGGHIVVYDRKRGCDVDADERWIVMQEPSSRHLAIATETRARDLMKGLADARTPDEARAIADGIFTDTAEDLAQSQDEETPPAAAPADPAAVDQALERFFNAEDPATERAAWRDLVEASPAKKRRP